MNYIGSKLTLLPFIENSIIESIGDISNKTFLDLFAGSGVVGNYFNGKVLSIIANDIEWYSYIINSNSLINSTDYSSSISDLNNLNSYEGFIWKHYSPAGGRLYFTEENAKKIDAIRNEIFKRKIPFLYRAQALASLIESVDKVANTASVYGAYLKSFKKTALKPFILKPIFFQNGNSNNTVYNTKAEEIIKEVSSDIAYLDPPYNARQYGSNYHLLNTISSCRKFIPKGITGLPENYNKSIFCSKKTVENAFFNLLNEIKAKHIFLSYNNEGLMSLFKIEEIMKKIGKYKLFTIDYKRFKADSNREYKANSTVEHLHYLEKK